MLPRPPEFLLGLSLVCLGIAPQRTRAAETPLGLNLGLAAELTVATNVARALSDTDNPGRSAIGFDGTNFLVVYHQTYGGSNVLMGVRIAGDGAVLDKFPITRGPASAPNPSLAFDGAGYLLVFQRDGEIWGMRLSTSGEVLDGPDGFNISTGVPFVITDVRPAIAFDGRNYLVVWSRYDGMSQDIYGARISRSGQTLNEFPIAVGPTAQTEPAVAFGGTNFLVAWEDSRLAVAPEYYSDLFAARVTTEGAVLDRDGIRVSTAPGNQSSSHVASDGTNYFVVWVHSRTTNSFFKDIYGARVSMDGTLLDGPPDTGGVAISTSDFQKVAPRIRTDGRRYLVTWVLPGYDNNPDGGVAGVYLARLSFAGKSLDGPPRTGGVQVAAPDCFACQFAFPECQFDGKRFFLVWLNNREAANETKEILGAFLVQTNFTLLKSFGSRTQRLSIGLQSLILGSDGTLYGTSSGGGSPGRGSLFKLEINGGGYETLHAFGQAGLDDGIVPLAGVIEAKDGRLYGTTWSGGTSNVGTVFGIDRDGGDYSVLHSFSYNGDDGASPLAPVIEGSDGMLYGTTVAGGTLPWVSVLGAGTVFKLNKNGTGFQLLHTFGHSNDDGRGPEAGLIEASDGAFYGTTSGGGTTNQGTVFKLNKDGTGYQVLHHFLADGSGQIPESGVIEGSDGALYGTTQQGGAGSGTVFTLRKDGTGFRVVHSFDFMQDNGRSPRTGLIWRSDGTLYGSTLLGGTRDEGTVFRLKSDGSGFRILHSFVRTAGVTDLPAPTRLFAGLDGALYGATISGGRYGAGAVFRLVPPPDTMTIGLLSNGAVQLAVRGLSGQTLKIESSDDLGAWQTFTTGTVTNGSLEVQVSNVVGTRRQFYRARSEP